VSVGIAVVYAVALSLRDLDDLSVLEKAVERRAAGGGVGEDNAPGTECRAACPAVDAAVAL